MRLFQAAQSDRPERQAAAALLIRISGSSSGKPRFTSQSYVVQVLESVPTNSQLLRLTAVDVDEVVNKFTLQRFVV